MSISLNAVDLPGDLNWSDEYDWSPVTQSIKKGLTGALIIQEATQQHGRPITLVGGDDFAWVTKATLEQLRALEIQPDLQMTLSYHGTDYTVRFRRESAAPIQARPVVDFANPQNDDFYSLTLRLMTVS